MLGEAVAGREQRVSKSSDLAACSTHPSSPAIWISDHAAFAPGYETSAGWGAEDLSAGTRSLPSVGVTDARSEIHYAGAGVRRSAWNLACAATSAPPAALGAAGAPWWALVIASLPGTAVLILQALLPQNSRDRLEWWRDRRRHREHLAQSRARRPPPAGSSARSRGRRAGRPRYWARTQQHESGRAWSVEPDDVQDGQVPEGPVDEVDDAELSDGGGSDVVALRIARVPLRPASWGAGSDVENVPDRPCLCRMPGDQGGESWWSRSTGFVHGKELRFESSSGGTTIAGTSRMWSIPGGGADSGEQPSEAPCLRRAEERALAAEAAGPR
ncbi:hypothetical protein GCM10010211_55920 [Streptomyces albospinus]|uniref:Uncharacterized protein n=1 Tax=Streptomyces albospinus TaxID=285515 RepID=A0ABQ2VG57_9ACTN|nr:hypothetical protein GCM10010211_55920 [Streptomyces albospinus]